MGKRAGMVTVQVVAASGGRRRRCLGGAVGAAVSGVVNSVADDTVGRVVCGLWVSRKEAKVQRTL